MFARLVKFLYISVFWRNDPSKFDKGRLREKKLQDIKESKAREAELLNFIKHQEEERFKLLEKEYDATSSIDEDIFFFACCLLTIFVTFMMVIGVYFIVVEIFPTIAIGIRIFFRFIFMLANIVIVVFIFLLGLFCSVYGFYKEGFFKTFKCMLLGIYISSITPVYAIGKFIAVCGNKVVIYLFSNCSFKFYFRLHSSGGKVSIKDEILSNFLELERFFHRFHRKYAKYFIYEYTDTQELIDSKKKFIHHDISYRSLSKFGGPTLLRGCKFVYYGNKYCKEEELHIKRLDEFRSELKKQGILHVYESMWKETYMEDSRKALYKRLEEVTDVKINKS